MLSIGNVDGCDCILVDDMIDTAGTLCAVGYETCHKYYYNDVYWHYNWFAEAHVCLCVYVPFDVTLNTKIQ